MMNTPKFKKIVLVKKNSLKQPSSTIVYENSSMVITGNFILISDEINDVLGEYMTSTIIYDISEIHSYKLYD